MHIPTLIARKRDGGELGHDELAWLVEGFVAGAVAPEQMSALLMAGVLRGFSDDEAVALTAILVSSGEQLDLSSLRGPVVDKHSTGGVGDTTTLIVAPVLAACGVQVAKLSGAGLGHTGGTIDKLAAIPGMRTDLAPDELLEQVDRIGLALSTTSARLAPADKHLYALRDVTGTVPSPALIASSVMSKKLAAGAPNIVLDVKAGSGGVVGDRDDALELAALCRRIGVAGGRRVACLVTDMEQPLGSHIGNALEVRAAIDVLQGAGDDRLREASVALAAAGLELADVGGRPEAEEALASGRGLETFREWILAQGGPNGLVEDPASHLPAAPVRQDVPAAGAGVVVAVQPRQLGNAAVELGAGRRVPGDVVDPAVGIVVHVRAGAVVAAGEPLATVHAARDADAAAAVAAVAHAIDVQPEGQVSTPSTPVVLAQVGLGDDARTPP